MILSLSYWHSLSPHVLAQLPPVDKDAGIVDVAVIGCGPAGLSISAELALQGVSVALIGRDQPFVNNYGVWVDEFKGERNSRNGRPQPTCRLCWSHLQPRKDHIK